MPKRKPTYGDETKKRVECLLKRLLAYVYEELDPEDYKIHFRWETSKQVIVTAKRTQLEVLTDLKSEQVRDALNIYLRDFLNILEDLRTNKRGTEEWHFRLTLWHEKGKKQENLSQFDTEWDNKRKELPGVQRTEKRTTKSAPTPYHNLPNSGVVEFVGRNEELKQIHEMLQQNNLLAITAIAGMGGVGKTELALQYVKNHLTTYPGGICWLLASQNVGLQVVQLAERFFNLKPPENLKSDLSAQVGYCWQYWHKGEVLLVMDNVTDYKEVKPYLPSQPSPRFKVLITTREEMQKPIEKLDLNVLKPRAAMNLLKSLVGRERLQREPWVPTMPLA